MKEENEEMLQAEGIACKVREARDSVRGGSWALVEKGMCGRKWAVLVL